jgi:nucleotide-binding universal stress UspA family protein
VLVVKGRSTGMRRALVAVDGSEDSWAAARFFGGLPLPRELRVRLLAVLDLPPMAASAEGSAPAGVTTPEALIVERRAVLEGVLSRVAASYQGVVRDVECSVVIGRPAAEIVSAAHEPGVGLVVVGARGVGRIRRWLLGSISEQVLHRADCPVLVVPASPRSAASSRPATQVALATSVAPVLPRGKAMSTYFVIGDQTTHLAGDPECPECWEDYPERCPCGEAGSRPAQVARRVAWRQNDRGGRACRPGQRHAPRVCKRT